MDNIINADVSLVDQVLPHYYELPELAGQDVKDQLCKLAAELAVNTDKVPDPATAASNVYDR